MSEAKEATGSCCASAQTPEPTPAAADCCEAPKRRDWLLWGSATLVLVGWLFAVFGTIDDHHNPLGMFSAGVYELFNKMWWGMAIGAVFVGLLARVPRELVMSVLGRKAGWGSLGRAALAGVFLDLCSHGILAVGMKLYERGASNGQVMAFLLASPWNSFSLTLILIGLIGLGWTLLFIVLSLVIGLITGAMFDALTRRGTLPQNRWREELDEERPFAEQYAEFRQGLHVSPQGLVDVLRDGIAGSRVVIRWGLFGIVLAALIRAFVPEDAFATWFGASMLGLWLTLLASTIIEVCSEGATPIAADLMNRAAAPGNSFTFLMAGVATDYTEIMSIKDTAGSWKLALFLPLLTVPQVMVLGYLLNTFG